MSITLQSQLKAWLLPGLILGYLWFVLINHLRIKWEVNPQYSYGWAVPFLCAYLIYLRRQESGVRSQESRGRIQNSEFKNHHCAAPVALSKTQNSKLGKRKLAFSIRCRPSVSFASLSASAGERE